MTGMQGVLGKNDKDRLLKLSQIAAEIRIDIVNTIAAAKMGHIGGDFSVTDILVSLFFGVMNYKSQEPHWADRDRFILSKGHCSAALYSVMAKAGYFKHEQLGEFMQPLSFLGGHPNRRKLAGIEANTGPLGHGLPIGVGCATGAKLAKKTCRTFVVLGDGELQEGSNWEAAMYAGHRKLENLMAIVDRNRLQQGAGTEDTNALDPLPDKWRSFGWDAYELDGHNFQELLEVMDAPFTGKPKVIIANTIKGKGVSFIENRVEWHHKVPSAEQNVQAIKELTHS
ncbi:transketolase [Commensalibacter oyaizuii]|uniref:Transketolase n=1 Tax=Commensalibacter oyaizuii TaxID=3043873 RepID=A0ABT6Q161_9PROT|nr:transketolase [Commensalibacter sp. TBRC 16381]MDI2090844.1 transketolase [Commensalibacter sp. TBRC 16381]